MVPELVRAIKIALLLAAVSSRSSEEGRVDRGKGRVKIHNCILMVSQEKTSSLDKGMKEKRDASAFGLVA